MNKIIILLSLTLGFISCKNSDTKIDQLAIAKQYYQVLDHSDDVGVASLLSDSIVIRESEYDYQETFTPEEYVEWMKWDAVFDPTYEILEIELEHEVVRAKISKVDKRIMFLHQEPIVTHEIVSFDANKIIQIERTEYLVFNDSTFVKNREDLLSWIDQNHPELNGFIHDQTESGGMKYLEAIELYNHRK